MIIKLPARKMCTRRVRIKSFIEKREKRFEINSMESERLHTPHGFASECQFMTDDKNKMNVGYSRKESEFMNILMLEHANCLHIR